MKNKKNITVLQVATVNHPIRKDFDSYGPVEMVIFNIDKGLHSMGHRSIVACSADSRVTGEHFATVDQSLGDYFCKDTARQQKVIDTHFSKVVDRIKSGDIDLIHTHDVKMVESLYEFASEMNIPILTTLHISARESLLREDYNRWSNPQLAPFAHYVPISEYQKSEYDDFMTTEKAVLHGIEVDDYPMKDLSRKDGYLFVIGRITADKGQDKAIEVARKTGLKLIIAGCVQNKVADMKFFEEIRSSIDLFIDGDKDDDHRDYYKNNIRPIIDSEKQVIYIGEISNDQKMQWYKYARATLFPIKWGEPFGLVMIESMSCGTPVVAFNQGSVPEIIVDGATGYLTDSVETMAEAVRNVVKIDPWDCRKHVKNNFSIKKMAREYADIYFQLIENHSMVESKISDSDKALINPLPQGTVATS